MGLAFAVGFFCFACFIVGLFVIALVRAGSKADELMEEEYEKRNQKKELE